MFDSKKYNQKMDKTIDVFSKELNSLRTGRANANMLDIIKVVLKFRNIEKLIYPINLPTNILNQIIIINNDYIFLMVKH